jgi:hypothetical protein
MIRNDTLLVEPCTGEEQSSLRMYKQEKVSQIASKLVGNDDVWQVHIPMAKLIMVSSPTSVERFSACLKVESDSLNRTLYDFGSRPMKC